MVFAHKTSLRGLELTHLLQDCGTYKSGHQSSLGYQTINTRGWELLEFDCRKEGVMQGSEFAEFC